MRCFVALPLSPECRAAIVAAGEALRQEDAHWRDDKWVAPEHLHITLKFLGELPEQSARSLADSLSEVLGTVPPFELPIGGVIAVPGTRRARMVWATFLDPDGQCSAIAEKVEVLALGVGVPPDARSFKPHVTMSRARHPHACTPAALHASDQVLLSGCRSMSVARATLFESRLTPRGPAYSVLADAPLKGE